MVVDKALRGLATANLRSLRFSSDPVLLRDYLRDLETVYQSYTYAPLEPVELPELLGKDFNRPLFLPLGHIRPGSTPLSDLAAIAALTQKKRFPRLCSSRMPVLMLSLILSIFRLTTARFPGRSGLMKRIPFPCRTFPVI
jgi:hypothetical protein